MAKLSKNESKKRRELIIDTCAELYQVEELKDITINEIGLRLPFTRTSIYTYFDNKEEIVLALLGREYLKWQADLKAIMAGPQLDVAGFTKALTWTLANRQILLKILSQDINSLEKESRIEHLTDFKEIYGQTISLLDQVVSYHFPTFTNEVRQAFLFSFLPFLYGVHPYTVVNEKQTEAMRKANVPFVYYGQDELIANCIKNLLS